MFREMLRKKQELSKEECIEILKKEKRGVLSVLGDEGYPYGMPINHYYDEESGKLYFHGGKKGHKIDAMKRLNKALLKRETGISVSNRSSSLERSSLLKIQRSLRICAVNCRIVLRMTLPISRKRSENLWQVR